MNPARKVQTKQTAGRKSKVPAALAHSPQNQTGMHQKNPQKNLLKKFFVPFCVGVCHLGKLLVPTGGCALLIQAPVLKVPSSSKGKQ